MRFIVVAIGLALVACTGSSGERGAPPPAGFPTLAARYAVAVDLYSGSCAPAGFLPGSQVAIARVVQDGRALSWSQTDAEERSRPLELKGQLTINPLGRFQVEICGRARRLVQTEGGDCEVRLSLPRDPNVGQACQPFTLTLDDQGRLQGLVHAEVFLNGEACPGLARCAASAAVCRQVPACELSMCWVAVPDGDQASALAALQAKGPCAVPDAAVDAAIIDSSADAGPIDAAATD